MSTMDQGTSNRQGSRLSSSGMSRLRRHGLRRKSTFWVGVAVLVVLVSLCAAGGLIAYQVSTVRVQLEKSIDLVPELRSEVEDGDYDAAEETFSSIAEYSAAARSTTTGPLWTFASSIPLAGPNFSAVREGAISLDEIMTGAVTPLLRARDSFDWQALSPRNGHIDIAQMADVSPSIRAASNVVRLSHDRLALINVSALLPQVADPIRSASEQLHGISAALSTASSAAELLPPMLGSDGARNYLVLVENSAEVRATGGIPGALAIVNVSNGQISLGEQSSASTLGAFKPPIEVDSQQTDLFTARIGTQMQNVNLTPDFPTAASTAKRMWEERHPGHIVDGVLSLDPVALSYLLAATGPVKLTDPQILALIKDTSLPTSLTAQNVVPTLLSGVYREIEDPVAQDVYFASVAGSVFATFAEGNGDSGLLLNALATSSKEHRIHVWSSLPQEQKTLESTALGGSVAGPQGDGATFGAYFNDGTGAKMDYYASRTVQLLQTCKDGVFNGYTVRTTVTNNAPLDAALSLPPYVTGGGVFGVEPGRIRTNHVVYGPSQSFVEAASINGEAVAVGSGKHGQRPVGIVTLEVGPGETAILDVQFSRVVQESAPRLVVTPMISPLEVVALPTISDTSCK